MIYGIADNIRASARRKDIPLRDIAEKLNITPTAMSRKLDNPRTIRVTEFLTMAELFGWGKEAINRILNEENELMKKRREI